MTTEKEAAEMWCPFIRMSSRSMVSDWNGSYNRNHNPDDQIQGQHGPMTCIGSRCMAWRWDDTGPPETRHGYCGLAGQLTRFLGGVY